MGDIVWLDLEPRVGHAQAGHRPVLVLSPFAYNKQRGMMICCPMTSRIKGYGCEVVVGRSPPSAVLADQIGSVDWRARRSIHKGTIEQPVLIEVQAKIRVLLNL